MAPANRQGEGNHEVAFNPPNEKPMSAKPWLQKLVKLVRAVGRPVERFLHIEAASGIVLLIAAAIALSWANSPWGDSYASFWHASAALPGPWHFERSLEWVVNDALMVIFFFVVGMEIRREIHNGELRDVRRAMLPTLAALGGMVAPALVYLSIAGTPSTRSGWGVPMATDIAFAVGVLTLLGKRVPPALRVLLLALAVIDDLGAIIVIALFYSSGISLTGLAIAGAGIAIILGMRRFGMASPWAYLAPALVTWAGVYAAGIHPTIAGVIVGLLTPVKSESQDTGSVADRLIEALHPYVAFLIMPVFALANAGVKLDGLKLDDTSTNVLVGAGLGLVLGKPLGVVLASLLAVKLRVATLPPGLSSRHLWVLGVVAGIGFTMALFIAALAFEDARYLAAAKLGVLIGSGVAGGLGLGLGRLLLKPATQTAS
jgi:NhaA family Na+:H+ antiporter